MGMSWEAAPQRTETQAKNAVQQPRQPKEDWHAHKERQPLKQRDGRQSSLDQEFWEKFLHRGRTQFLKNIRNRSQGFPGKKPDFSHRLSAIYAFDQNVEIAFTSGDCSDYVFIGPEWVWQ